MTRREALAFMEKHRWQVCVNYEVDEDGEILYAPEPPSRWARQLDGALRLAAAAALVVPLLSACEEAPEQIQPTASTPIVISADGAKINADETAQPGAGRSPRRSRWPSATFSWHRRPRGRGCAMVRSSQSRS